MNDKEGCALAAHLIKAAKAVYGKTQGDCEECGTGDKNFFDQIASQMKGGNGLWSDNHTFSPWGFNCSHSYMDSVNHESMEAYFNLLEDTLKDHDLMNHPAKIYNMDESGMPLDAQPPNMVAKRGKKKVHYQQSGKNKQISVIGCANVVGQFIPPLVIFEGMYLNLQWLEKCQVHTMA